MQNKVLNTAVTVWVARAAIVLIFVTFGTLETVNNTLNALIRQLSSRLLLTKPIIKLLTPFVELFLQIKWDSRKSFTASLLDVI